jgi:hypothetical protein
MQLTALHTFDTIENVLDRPGQIFRATKFAQLEEVGNYYT